MIDTKVTCYGLKELLEDSQKMAIEMFSCFFFPCLIYSFNVGNLLPVVVLANVAFGFFAKGDWWWAV